MTNSLFFAFARRRTLVALFATAAALIAAPLHAQPTVVSVGANSFDGSFGRYSDGGTYSTFAQTFVTPAGAPSLQGFSLYLSDDFGQGSSLNFRAHVFEFDVANRRLLGTALFSSLLRQGSSNLSGFDAYLFNASPGNINLALNPSRTYAFVLSALGLAPATYASVPDGATNSLGASDVDAYAGGRAWRSLANEQLSDLGTNHAFEAAAAPDLAFDATFTPTVVPEPSTLLLLGAALGMLAVVRGRRRA